MTPKLSIAVHSGVLSHWPLLQNLLKSFLYCNHYPNIELILVESAGNKEIRDWFEKIDFNDYFLNFDGVKTDIKKPHQVNIEKTLKFIDFDESVFGRGPCYGRAISQCIESFKGDLYTILAEDNQFIVEGNLFEDYVKIFENFGIDKTMIYFFSQHQYKLYKENNFATGPHKLESSDLQFFTPIYQKWDMGGICSRGFYNDAAKLRQEKGWREEDVWDIRHGIVEQYTSLLTMLDCRRVYPSIPCGVWMYNDHQDAAKKKIIDGTKSDVNFLLYQTRRKADLLSEIKNSQHPIPSEYYSVEN